MPAKQRLFNRNLLGLLLLTLPVNGGYGALPELTQAQLSWLGDQIFRNECNSRVSCLTSWNAGESFPSLGLGHFIWFTAGQTELFTETFPQLLDFYQSRGHALPEWLQSLRDHDSPWSDRDSFYREFDGPRLSSLRQFLLDTKNVQTDFIARRLESALPRILAAAPATQRPALEQLFHDLAGTAPPHGIYALVDYVNFKGEGIAESERYAGQGWGLLQVLQEMLARGAPHDLPQFADAAAEILARRVANAPAERDEQQWLQGWRNRLQTYLPAGNSSTPFHTPGTTRNVLRTP